MQVQELLDKLIEAITVDKWNRLKHGDSSLVISSFKELFAAKLKNNTICLKISKSLKKCI